MIRVIGAARALLVSLSLLSGCTHMASPVAPEPEVVFHPAGAEPVHVRVELARTAAETERGLMYRDHLDDGRGMLFLFAAPKQQVFWMHNTYIPLDMIFLGADRRVVGVVERAQPLTDTPRAVPGLSQYVLEVPGGWSVAHRVGPGTPATFAGFE